MTIPDPSQCRLGPTLQPLRHILRRQMGIALARRFMLAASIASIPVMLPVAQRHHTGELYVQSSVPGLLYVDDKCIAELAVARPLTLDLTEGTHNITFRSNETEVHRAIVITKETPGCFVVFH